MKISRVLVSQPKPDSPDSPFVRLAELTGAAFDFRQFIRVEGVTTYEFRKQKIDLAKFPSVVFNSKTSVDHFFRICEEVRYTIPDSLRYFCLTENIALYLQKYIVYRKRKVFIAEGGALDSLIEQMQKYREERFLFPVSNVQKADQLRDIRKAGIRVTKAVLYNTVSSDIKDVDISSYDLLVFYSPFGIKSLFENFPEFQQGEIKIAAYGKTTHRAAKSAGLTINVPVPSPRFQSMTDALERFICEANEKE